MSVDHLFDLTGKVAIVTGGGNGIGKATCLMLAEAGASVTVSDYRLEDARKVSDTIIEKGGKAIAVKCDVTKDEDMVEVVSETIKAFGKINILVNNAGGGGGGKENPFEIGLSQFISVFEKNVFSTWRLCQLCAPHMKSTGEGSIINISSMASINKSPSMSAYASSKAAINHMTANLAHDFGPEIRVNAVGPGAIRTDALKRVLTDEMEKKMLSKTPIKRLGEAEDIAAAVLYFASPASKWVSGQVLFVNGGGEQTLD